MIKKIKYIIISIAETINKDAKESYNNFSRPKEMMNLFFWLIIILVLTDRFFYARIAVACYVASYIWKILKNGDWKRRMRNSYRR